MRAVVQIDGGIGRCICAIPALEQMAKTREVIVAASHPEIFYNNPNLYKVYGLNREYFFDDVLQYCEFFYPEPYWDHHFYQQRKHLISSFSSLLNKEDSAEVKKPNIYLTDEEMQEADTYIKTIKTQIGNRKIIAFQPFGASYNEQIGKDNSNRSLTPKTVSFLLANLFDDCCFINFTNNKIEHAAMCYDVFPVRKLLALIPFCDYAITVDSFLAHAGYTFGIPGTQFFGGTSSLNFGYPEHYHTVCREGYPKSYMAFRMSGCLEKNQGAMDFTEDELLSIIAEIKNRLGVKPCSCVSCESTNS